jgi:hypothetical protein
MIKIKAATKSLDTVKVIAAMLTDVSKRHPAWFNSRDLRLTLNRVYTRSRTEGVGFLTKTLPRLGKAIDLALNERTRLNCVELRLAAQPHTQLPRFLGEFFKRVFDHNGVILPEPCINSIRVLRQLCLVFYKYEVAYTADQEQEVIDQFTQTERDLAIVSENLRYLSFWVKNAEGTRLRRSAVDDVSLVRKARQSLSRLFASFDPMDIIPCHGPGAVATKQKLWAKYQWSNVSSRITDVYPFDAYFCASQLHVCDTYSSFSKISEEDLPARVILVPKDSRGPRLISCEPVDFQWIQGGLRKAIVSLVEHDPIVKHQVHFTDQSPNRCGAQLGSAFGKYATLDLKEASDRVSTELVRLLFPSCVVRALEACRSSATVLPSGQKLTLHKFAPMGSSLCFPIMALTIWSLLDAAAPDQATRERILVYGDDVIVPTAFAGDAIYALERFGLLVNRPKSCIQGFFRESCGMDAFKGSDVTPVRIRTVWNSSPSPESYTSWISYANSFYDRNYYTTYDYIVQELHRVYGPIPSDRMQVACPRLRVVADELEPRKYRTDPNLQKRLVRVRDVKARALSYDKDGWVCLLRFLTEDKTSFDVLDEGFLNRLPVHMWERRLSPLSPHSVSSYTARRSTKLVERWLDLEGPISVPWVLSIGPHRESDGSFVRDNPE